MTDKHYLSPGELRQSRVVCYSPDVVDHLDSVAAAIVLHQLSWLLRPFSDGNHKAAMDAQGYLICPLSELMRSTRLKRRALEAAQEALEQAGVVETKRGPDNGIRWRLLREGFLRVNGRLDYVQNASGEIVRTSGGNAVDVRTESPPTSGGNADPHVAETPFLPSSEIDRSQKRSREPEPGVNSVAAKSVRAAHAAVQARNLFAEPKPETVTTLLGSTWLERGEGKFTLEAAWATAYPELWAQPARKQTALDVAHGYMMDSDADWSWPRKAIPKIESILQKAEDEARKMALANARAGAQRVETAVDLAHQPAPADAAERDAFNRCYPRDGYRPPRTIQIWRDAGRPTSWPPGGSDEAATTPQRVNAPAHAPDEKPPMSPEQENEGRAIMLAELAKVAAKLTDRPQPQQRAPQRAEEAPPKESEEAKAARRAEAVRLVAEAETKLSQSAHGRK